MSERIGIVGGGLLGLSLAERLQRLGHRATVLEAAPHFGGLAAAWKLFPSRAGNGPHPVAARPPSPSETDFCEVGGRGLRKDSDDSPSVLRPPLPPSAKLTGGEGEGPGVRAEPLAGSTTTSIRWDKFYHVILQSDSHTHALLRDLGLSDDFVGVTTKTGFYTDGRLHSMSNSWEFLKFPPLGLWSKFRLGRTISHAAKVTDWKALEAIPVVDWLTRWSGRKTVEKIWLPLLKSKLGDAYKVASAAFIWATIQRLYAARRSGMKKELFGYVRGGYGRIVDRFTEALAGRGVGLRANAAVARIDSEGEPRVELASGETLDFDRVICTAVPPLVPKLMPNLTDGELDLLNGVRYQGIVCASVLLRRPLDRFYVTNITDGWVPFTGVIEMSALVDRAEFGGHHLVYLPKYVAPDDPVMTEPDDSIRERFTAALERMYPHFQRADVLAFQIARVKNVFAVPTLNYSERLPPMATSLPGVYLVNSAHIVNGTLNVNETLQLAERAMPTVTAPLPVAV